MDSDSDEKDALQAATNGVAEWLTNSGLINHVVRHLTLDQIEGIAVAAISAWVNRRAELAARPSGPEEDRPPLAV